jgi:hypothetical protein
MKSSMKQTLLALAMASVVIPSAAGQGAGKVILQDFSIATGTASKDDAHKETIEIASWSLGSVNGNLQITSLVVPPAVVRLCQSKAAIPSMLLEADGRQREFRNVVFKECPAGGSGGTFMLTFDGQPGESALKKLPGKRTPPTVTLKRGSTLLHGLRGGPVTVTARELSILKGSATLTLAKEGVSTAGLFSPGQIIPELTIELENRQKWSFTGVKVTSATASAAAEEIAFTYGKLQGPPTGFAAGTN